MYIFFILIRLKRMVLIFFIYKINKRFIFLVFEHPVTKKKQILLNGYKYTLQCMNKSKGRWRCVKQRSGCKSIIVTVDDEIIYIKNEHNHELVHTFHL